MRRLFPAAALILALAACGSRQVTVHALGEGTVTYSATTPTTEATTGSNQSIGTQRPTDAGRAAPRTLGSESRRLTLEPDDAVDYGDDFGPAKHNTMRLDVSLSAACATPGQNMRATATTVPGSKLAFAASYSDNDFIPNFLYVPGEGNPTGTFTWTWEITPSTPRGDALVTVVAAKGQKGASFEAPFRVADSC